MEAFARELGKENQGLISWNLMSEFWKSRGSVVANVGGLPMETPGTETEPELERWLVRARRP